MFTLKIIEVVMLALIAFAILINNPFKPPRI